MNQMTQTYTDPVCGKQLTINMAADYSTYNGETYYFCCLGEKEEFDQDPEKFINALEEEAA